jgi:hypothetical protein
MKVAVRLELRRYVSTRAEDGIMSFIDLNFHNKKPYQFTGRLQFFETGSYDSRIYAFERDVLYSYSVLPVFGKGIHFQISSQIDASRLIKKIFQKKVEMNCWLSWTQNNFAGNFEITSINNEITSKKKSNFCLQMILRW